VSDLIKGSKIAGYLVVESTSISALVEQVINMTDEGWSLLGSHQVCAPGPDEYLTWSQTLVLLNKDAV
jgi:hypothetical protein